MIYSLWVLNREGVKGVALPMTEQLYVIGGFSFYTKPTQHSLPLNYTGLLTRRQRQMCFYKIIWAQICKEMDSGMKQNEKYLRGGFKKKEDQVD